METSNSLAVSAQSNSSFLRNPSYSNSSGNPKLGAVQSCSLQNLNSCTVQMISKSNFIPNHSNSNPLIRVSNAAQLSSSPKSASKSNYDSVSNAHASKTLNSKSNSNSSLLESPKSSVSNEISTIDVFLTQANASYIKVNYKNFKLIFLIDTGANVSLIL